MSGHLAVAADPERSLLSTNFGPFRPYVSFAARLPEREHKGPNSQKGLNDTDSFQQSST